MELGRYEVWMGRQLDDLDEAIEKELDLAISDLIRTFFACNLTAGKTPGMAIEAITADRKNTLGDVVALSRRDV